MLALSEKQMLISAIGRVIVDEVKTAVAPLVERIEKIEAAPSPDINGLRDQLLGNISGFRTSVEQQFAVVQQQFAALPVPKDGADGKDGLNGKDGIDGKDGEKGEKGEAGPPGPQGDQGPPGEKGESVIGPPGERGLRGDPGEPGKDGIDGRNGADGKSVSLDDIRDCLADLVRKAFADIPVPRSCVGGFIDRRGHLFLSFSDGGNSDLGEVTGKDGKDCDIELVRTQVATFLATIEKPKDGKDGKDGVDGVGFDDMQLDFDGERSVIMKYVKGEAAKVINLLFPVPIERGVWKQGDYDRADIVQRDGSMWIAERNTNGVPGQPDSGWRLSTKRGRDGKEGPQGKPGLPGKDGRDGRDLTQIGPDGSKW